MMLNLPPKMSVRSIIKGGAKLGFGLFTAGAAVALCSWGYVEWEESKSAALAKAKVWEAQDVEGLQSTVFLKTKLEEGALHYIVTLESPRRPAARFIDILLADDGGFTLASESIPISDFVQEGGARSPQRFHVEGVINGYYSDDLYRRAVKWHVGWKLPSSLPTHPLSPSLPRE